MLLWFAVKVIISPINLMLNYLKRSSCFSGDLTHAFTFLSVPFEEKLVVKYYYQKIIMHLSSCWGWPKHHGSTENEKLVRILTFDILTYIVYKALTKDLDPGKR